MRMRTCKNGNITLPLIGRVQAAGLPYVVSVPRRVAA